MRIDWNVPIPMDDGLVLRAEVFRAVPEGKYPVILSYGPHDKGLAFQDGYPNQWQRMTAQHPDVAAGSTNKYQNWEVVDPEKWVPDGYACVRVASRGGGCSPGDIDHFSPRETRDLYHCIEWAAAQPWCSGNVGLNGISYYAINQWHVASLEPPHLAAMCVWEGAADWYRDMTRHGGILCTFWANWYDMQVKTVQYGLGARGPRSRVTGEPACGPETLPEEELAKRRGDLGNEIAAHPLDDDYHKARSPVGARVGVPFLTAGDWGGPGPPRTSGPSPARGGRSSPSTPSIRASAGRRRPQPGASYTRPSGRASPSSRHRWTRRWRSPDRRRRSFSCPPRRRTPTSSWCSGSSRRTGKRGGSRAPSIPTPPSARAGSGPRTGSSTPPSALATVPITPPTSHGR